MKEKNREGRRGKKKRKGKQKQRGGRTEVKQRKNT
jgi:hypothetical protein